MKGLCDLKDILAFEINSLKAQQANALTEHLKLENTFLKNELRETRLIINNILENVSRQNHSGESLKSKSDDNISQTMHLYIRTETRIQMELIYRILSPQKENNNDFELKDATKDKEDVIINNDNL